MEEAQHHFDSLEDLLITLGLEEAHHKASPPAPRMTWLGLHFDTLAIPDEKLQELNLMVQDRMLWAQTDIYQLRSLLGKLLHVTYCCPPERFS